MNIQIEKSPKSKGHYHQRAKGLGSSKVKQLAMRDISKCCELLGGIDFTMNYVNIEYIVLANCKIWANQFIHIDISNL